MLSQNCISLSLLSFLFPRPCDPNKCSNLPFPTFALKSHMAINTSFDLMTLSVSVLPYNTLQSLRQLKFMLEFIYIWPYVQNTTIQRKTQSATYQLWNVPMIMMAGVVMLMIITARSEFCEISLQYFAYNLKSFHFYLYKFHVL